MCAHGQVAEQMWQLVIVRARLLENLTAMKAYFLLSRGDFHQSFLLEVHHQDLKHIVNRKVMSHSMKNSGSIAVASGEGMETLK